MSTFFTLQSLLAASGAATDPIRYIPSATVIFFYAVRLHEITVQRNTIAGKVRENATLRLFLALGLAMLAGAQAEYFLTPRPISWPLFAVGVLCALGSLYVRRQAIAALGRFWSLHVEIREQHQLVRTGPFRYVRHPAYFSMILELLALVFMLNSRWMFVPFFVLFGPLLWLRIRIEESSLVEKFGDVYREYIRTTPAIIPYRAPKD